MRDYQQLAPCLDQLNADPEARVFYDLLADALVWSDELPPTDSSTKVGFNPSDLRGVWHYRTTMILGVSKEKHRGAWDEALRCFPGWPGFALERRSPALAATFTELKTIAVREWEQFEATYPATPTDAASAATA